MPDYKWYFFRLVIHIVTYCMTKIGYRSPLGMRCTFYISVILRPLSLKTVLPRPPGLSSFRNERLLIFTYSFQFLCFFQHLHMFSALFLGRGPPDSLGFPVAPPEKLPGLLIIAVYPGCCCCCVQQSEGYRNQTCGPP